MNESRWRVDFVEGITSGDESRLVHLSESAELHVRCGRLVRGTGYRSASADARRSLARVGAILRLRERNRYHVHASGVVDGRGRGWILVGESGSGKSTLAFALARGGWRVLGDDGVILEPAGDGAVVHGWRSPLMVSAGLAAHFPELAGREDAVIPDDPRRRIPCGATAARRAPLAAIVFVEQGANGGLAPCNKAEALARMIGQSPWMLLGDGSAAQEFRALGRVVAGVPTFRLRHGPAELPRVAALLDAALPGDTVEIREE